MDGVQYQVECLQQALSQLDPHRILSQEDMSQLQLALAHATSITRRVTEAQCMRRTHPARLLKRYSTNPSATHAAAHVLGMAIGQAKAASGQSECIQSVAKQHGVTVAEVRRHNPQLAAFADTDALPPNTFLKMRRPLSQVETLDGTCHAAPPFPLAPSPFRQTDFTNGKDALKAPVEVSNLTHASSSFCSNAAPSIGEVLGNGGGRNTLGPMRAVLSEGEVFRNGERDNQSKDRSPAIAQLFPTPNRVEEEDEEEYDTLDSIAAMYNVSVKSLIEWNQYLSIYKTDEPLPANLPIILSRES